jgi:hypothetical protein
MPCPLFYAAGREVPKKNVAVDSFPFCLMIRIIVFSAQLIYKYIK